jgi:hypothetical protein
VRDRLVAHFYASSFIMFLLSFAFSQFVPKALFFQMNGAGILYRAIVLVALSRDLLRPAAGRQLPSIAGETLTV